jgi:hypothetical protein
MRLTGMILWYEDTSTPSSVCTPLIPSKTLEKFEWAWNWIRDGSTDDFGLLGRSGLAHNFEIFREKDPLFAP